ncbi:MAG: Ppx/GppA family phosphatase [Inquilinus sp.]|nr:Ppx/GppA family phosphatase [Inquilinus sp.]
MLPGSPIAGGVGPPPTFSRIGLKRSLATASGLGDPAGAALPCVNRLTGLSSGARQETEREGGTAVVQFALDAADGTGFARGLPPRVTCAAVDLGTNNCRLLVARPTPYGFQVIDAFSRIVRLGEGVDQSGRLAPQAMGRTLSALRICAAKMRQRGVDLSRAVATEACRRAANFDQFRHRVDREVGLTLEVISADEEARLSLYGCAPLLDPGIPYALVFDIGGGSTELTWLSIDDPDGPRLVDCISLPIGVVNLSERHGGGMLSGPAYEQIVAEVAGGLAEFEWRNGIRARVDAGEVQALGSSGTVTTLAGVQRGLRRYDRSQVDGTVIDFDEAKRLCRWLLSLDRAERAAVPCIGRDRADLVVVGCAVLEAILDQWPAGQLRVADRGVREGILFDLMAGWHAAARQVERQPLDG